VIVAAIVFGALVGILLLGVLVGTFIRRGGSGR
jgi:hypothetical protein